jgi:CarD family transcriptional regulator
MNFKIGQKVAYPNIGVCSVEKIESRQVSGQNVDFFSLRLVANGSLVFVPVSNVKNINLRLIINSVECKKVMTYLAEEFAEVPSDWKIRSREFGEKIQSGNIYFIADVLKMLNYQNNIKPLSFREQRLFEKAKFLIVSELATVCSQPDCLIEEKINELLAISLNKHSVLEASIISYNSD